MFPQPQVLNQCCWQGWRLWEQQGSLGNATSSLLLSSKGQERLIKETKAGAGSGPSASNSTTRLHYFTLHSAAHGLFSMMFYLEINRKPAHTVFRQDLQLLNFAYFIWPQIKSQLPGDGEIMTFKITSKTEKIVATMHLFIKQYALVQESILIFNFYSWQYKPALAYIH